MNQSAKYTVILLFLGLLILPFVTMRTFYPFFRFAMFAEPAPGRSKMLRFEIWHPLENDEMEQLTADDLSISESTYHQLVQNYYYRNEAEEFLINLAKSLNRNPEGFVLNRIRPGIDTVHIATISK